MKTSQFSAEQIIKILDQAEKGEQTVGVVCREHRITETTFYRWRRAYGGMAVNEAQRLKELAKEGSGLHATDRLGRQHTLYRFSTLESLRR